MAKTKKTIKKKSKPAKKVVKVVKKVKPKKVVKRVKPKKVVKKPVKKIKPKKKPVKKIKKTTYKEALRKLEGRPKRRKLKKKVIPRKKVVRKVIRKPKKKEVLKPRVFVGNDPLDQLFESQAKVKLLKFFFRNAEDAFQLKDILKRLRSNQALVRQELKKLEKLGLVKQRKTWLTFETKTGKVKKEQKLVFYLNPGFEFFNELKKLVLKSAISSKDDLMKNIKKTGNIKLFVLNGVFTENYGALADLLIVGDRVNSRKLNDFLKNLEAEVGKELNCAVMNKKEFDYRYDMYDRFVRDLITDKGDVLIKKVILW